MKVFISWAHRGEDWTDGRTHHWEERVVGFARLLGALPDIEVALDFWVETERAINWNHWGPNQIDEADFVLIMMNEPWAQRWSGRNSPTFGAGAAAEANALHGLFNKDQHLFQQKVRVIILPEGNPASIPHDLSGVKSLTVLSLSRTGIDNVVRDLRDEPRHSRPQPASTDAAPSDCDKATGTDFSDGDMLLLRFRDLVPGVSTLRAHRKLLDMDPQHGVWWGWWKKPIEDPQVPVWSSFKASLDRAHGMVGLFDSGSPAGNVCRALAAEVLPPQPNDFGDTPPFTPPPYEWYRVPKYYRPKTPTHTQSCAWVRLVKIDDRPCRFYPDYQFVSDDPALTGTVIEQPSQLLTSRDQSLWHVRKVTR